MTLHRSAFIARILTAMLLAFPTIHAVARGWNGAEVLVGWIELAALVALVLPGVWKFGAVLLLAVFVLALALHAAQGSSMMWLAYPAIILLLLLEIDRETARSVR